MSIFLPLAATSCPFSLLPCLDALLCSVYFSLSVGVTFSTSGVSSSLLSSNQALLPGGIGRKPPGHSRRTGTQLSRQKNLLLCGQVFWPHKSDGVNALKLAVGLLSVTEMHTNELQSQVSSMRTKEIWKTFDDFEEQSFKKTHQKRRLKQINEPYCLFIVSI